MESHGVGVEMEEEYWGRGEVQEEEYYAAEVGRSE